MHQGVVAKYILNKFKALLILGGALLLVCCGSADDATSGNGESNEYLVTESSRDLTIHMSENGRTSYIFEAPLVKGYTLASEPYRIFPEGVKITTFTTDDSLNTSTVNGVLTANYATYYEDRQLWEAIGDVLVIKSDGRELSSQQLFWDAVTKRIYSNVDTRIEDHSTGDLYNGEGFESNEEMTEWSFRKLKGRMRVEESVNRGVDNSSGNSSGNSSADSLDNLSDIEAKGGKGVSDTLAVATNGVDPLADETDKLDGNISDNKSEIMESGADTAVSNRGRGYAAGHELGHELENELGLELRDELEDELEDENREFEAELNVPELSLTPSSEIEAGVENRSIVDSIEAGVGLISPDSVVVNVNE